MQSFNIDYTDAALNTKAPFQFQCALRLWGSTLPTGSFLTTKIYIPETAKPPVRLYSVTETEAAFHDYLGAYIGSWYFSESGTPYDNYTLHLIKNKDGVLVGHTAVDPYTEPILKQTAVLAGGEFFTDANDFMLLPQCHIQRFSGICRAIEVGGITHTENVVLTAGTRTTLSVEDETIRVDLSGKYTPPEKNRICKLAIDGKVFWVGDQHLAIIPGVQSNLRIVTEASGVSFKGVMDV